MFKSPVVRGAAPQFDREGFGGAQYRRRSIGEPKGAAAEHDEVLVARIDSSGAEQLLEVAADLVEDHLPAFRRALVSSLMTL